MLTEKNKIKRIPTKILKMDDNNQYGQAMTKQFPYGCQKHPPNLLEFNKYHMKITLDIFLSLTLNFIIKIQKLCYSMKYNQLYWK